MGRVTVLLIYKCKKKINDKPFFVQELNISPQVYINRHDYNSVYVQVLDGVL